ncbi:MAG: V-type ATPase subunit [Actinobacteria bacterium]|nr:V-type ATPase subunit [Actinomycetota bacterium]
MRIAIEKPQVDYGYINARIRAMKSGLFSRAFFENLLAMSDVEEVVAALGKSEYREDVEKGTVKYPGILGIEEGLKDHLTTTFNKVLKIVGGNEEASKMINLLLGRWDLHNLRTIIRGKHAEASEDELKRQLIPAGQLDEVTLSELIKQPSVKASIDLLANWRIPYAKPLKDGYRRYLETKNLADLELSLDKFYYEFAMAETERGLFRGASLNIRLVHEFFSREIDFVNIMTAMRLVKEHLADKLLQNVVEEGPRKISAVKRFSQSPRGKEALAEGMREQGLARYFIKGGCELGIERLVELAKLSEVEDLVEAIRDTSYGQTLGEGLKRFFETGSISVMERLMEERIVKKTVALFKGDPLSLSLLVAYVWAKFNEVVNLRIILQGKAVGMPDDRIKEALVLV